MFEVLRKIYLNSILYDKRISKTFEGSLEYKPSAYLLSSITKIKNKKFNINDFTFEDVWTNKKLSQKQFKRLNNFFWILSLDLKSSRSAVQSIISNWIKINEKFNDKSWDFDTTSKRIISWLSNSKLTYNDCNDDYKTKFNYMIQKQALHLINHIENSKTYNDKLIGVTAIILVGLSFKNEKAFTLKGLEILKKVLKNSLDNLGFPKSRSIKQSLFYLKYLILIREWFKESHSLIPEFIDENIFYLGQSYAFFWKNTQLNILFNGNNISNNTEFDHYIKRLGYTFKNLNYEFSDYIILSNKKINLIMDAGSSPPKKISSEYQAGALSFEFASNGKKIFTNSGYYSDENIKLNELSKSSAVHNVLIIDDCSSCKFHKNSDNKFHLKTGLKVIKKKITYEKNYWKINASHDGYLKKYNLIYERDLEFYHDSNKLIGTEKIQGKKVLPNLKFEIRFHLDPNTKVMKTQDNKSIMIELENEGWKFKCDNYKINIDNGLYFGKKNSYTENRNIFVSGIINSRNNDIKWELTKI